MDIEVRNRGLKGKSVHFPKTPTMTQFNRQLGPTGTYKSVRVSSVASLANQEIMFPELLLSNEPQSMRFGNYTCRQYGLIAPRITGLSLYEKLFLKEHLNREDIQARVMPATVYNTGYKTQRQKLPNLSYYLYSKKDTHNRHLDKPIILELNEKFNSRSEKERFKKTNTMFNSLKERIMEEPDKSQLIAMAVSLILT